MTATFTERLLDRLQPLLPEKLRRPAIPVVPVVRLTGVIGYSTPLAPGMTIASVARRLERAFSVRNAAAVAVLINSPGGSAVQSHLIFRRIRALAEEKAIPVLVFVEDVAASGGYMIACAGDEIFVDPSSIVGSIGVIGAGFGFDRLLEKIGIERRVHTAGDHKSMLDPFRPENPEDVERLKRIQASIHETFIALVKGRRGTKLTAPDGELFTGEFWDGARGRALGLVDEIGEVRNVLRARYGEKVAMPLVGGERRLFGRLFGFGRDSEAGTAPNLASGFAADLASAVEARALWARFGL